MSTAIDYKTKWYPEMKPQYKEFDQDSGYWDMKYRDRYAHIIECLGKAEDITILGVGCGLGRALSYFKRFGASVVGVEPSDYAVKNSRLQREEIVHKNFLEAQFQEQFDVIHIEQVLSHMPDYETALEKAYSLLKENGVIVVEEPNDFNELQQELEAQYGRYWVTADHCNYFDFTFMSELLHSIGFAITKKYCTYPMEFFALQGWEYIGNETLGKFVHERRYKMLKKLGFHKRTSLLANYANANLGRDLVLYGKKVSI